VSHAAGGAGGLHLPVERKRARVKNVHEGTLSKAPVNRIYLVEGVPGRAVSG